MNKINIVNTLSIAGFDTSAGAGTLADVKTMSALNVYACAVITAVTAQNTSGVHEISYMPINFISKQIDTIFQDVNINAVKIGMLGNSEIALAVKESLIKWSPAHIILDPVMISKHGDYLLKSNATKTLVDQLLPLSTVITPNIPEAAIIIGEPPAENLADMRITIKKLYNKMINNNSNTNNKWVILKGGHLPGNEMVDMIFNGENIVEIPGKKIHTNNTHGTGCTLSAALTAFIAQGESVLSAAEKAKLFLTNSIKASNRLQVGQGYGPLHHFHKWF
ncbi:bifunctional hydroxymethylpyrimidine kinase/phosphomethylpyrimidine kinase [Candidatus Kinetoplastidibacterium crithidiae]|uniref:hydroxymethylpyrimidine kinase n=1 Tax=Candidatus Kinetoplastidibacterium crithidiae TCC036E TaxID=1208918 RepID=M1M5C5_9PROT|nr:bifunctional hydroxymethylpyrimidine kinase/phosphomethylpyrimidine kinase [Candidatus Kinetoplastibacterium crithidii]AFZ83088.1 phosphomethylpyrimidine kinase [Candidatus Kinetoplastibacterium crithidii (ex Angomonas deanei ATCC 30255)]AGF47365.1 phosphomethylpyrimidine kinase [Candidatus Kinetoplastibacterium crithidii TCC036E]